MDILPDLNLLSALLVQHGSLFLFILLTVGIIAFPIPEETLMLLAGMLMRHGTLSIPGTMAAACAGSIAGITVSYLIGRTAGTFFITKYGKWAGLTHRRLEKAHAWFERFGKWALFVGYFIPGVRHFTGLSAGATKLHLKQFALFAYTGAAVWVSIFLSGGYFFGHLALAMYEKIEFSFDQMILILVGIALLGAIGFIIYKKMRK